MFVILFLRLGNLPFTIYYLPSLNFQFSIFNFQFILNYFYYAFILSSFIVIFFTDLKYGIIPDKILYPAVVIFTIYHLSFIIYSPIVNHQSSIINNIFSEQAPFFFPGFVCSHKGKGMGFGDVKLAFLIGIVLGFPKIITALYLAFLTGAIVGSILIIWRKRN